MSQYQKSCMFCKREIKMSNETGKWLPMNLDGSFHSCNQIQISTGTKKVETKTLSLEERVKRLEDFVTRVPK
jgi:hypothetical protein